MFLGGGGGDGDGDGGLPVCSCMQGPSTCMPTAFSMRASLLRACHWRCKDDVAASCCHAVLCCAGSTTSGRQGLAPLTSTRCGCGGMLTGGAGSGMTRGTGMLRDAGRGIYVIIFIIKKTRLYH